MSSVERGFLCLKLTLSYLLAWWNVMLSCANKDFHFFFFIPVCHFLPKILTFLSTIFSVSFGILHKDVFAKLALFSFPPFFERAKTAKNVSKHTKPRDICNLLFETEDFEMGHFLLPYFQFIIYLNNNLVLKIHLINFTFEKV